MVALAPFARAEAALAGRLRALHAAGDRPASTLARRTFGAVDWTVAFRWLAERHHLMLAPAQADAVRMALTAPVSILTRRSLAEIAEDEGGNIAKARTGDPKVIPRRTGVKRRKKGAKIKVWHSNRPS